VAQTFTCNQAAVGGGNRAGFIIMRFSDSDGFGASNLALVASGAPTINITTTQANSAVCVLIADWNANTGTGRTWRTTAGSFTENIYIAPGNYTVMGGVHPDVGVIGLKTVGITAPTNYKSVIMAFEILGSSGGPPTADFGAMLSFI
jgi:hypothetical protein